MFVESITLNKETEATVAGKTVTLIATVLPENATNESVTWMSSDTEVVTVSHAGVVTGKKSRYSNNNSYCSRWK